MWTATVIAHYKVIFRNYPGGTEENHFTQDGRCSDQIYHVYQQPRYQTNLVSKKYKAARNKYITKSHVECLSVTANY
jgi:hypothetical protein